MVGRARRVGTEPVIGNIFLPTIPREAIPGMVVGSVWWLSDWLGLARANVGWNWVGND